MAAARKEKAREEHAWGIHGDVITPCAYAKVIGIVNDTDGQFAHTVGQVVTLAEFRRVGG